MRTAMLAAEFNLLCCLIFVVKEISGEAGVEIHFVETADLISTTDQHDTYLLDLSFNERKKLCALMYDKIKQSAHLLTGTPAKLNRPQSPPFLSVAVPFFYAPLAHFYKFDDKEEWLSVRCRALPAFYVSHKTINESEHYWHIWIEKPALNHFKFRFETFIGVLENVTENPSVGSSPTRGGHYFYTMSKLERWYLCLEARRISNYIVDEKRIYDIPGRAKIYSFEYSKNFWIEEHLAFKCFGSPQIFLRTGDTSIQTHTIWISLEETQREIGGGTAAAGENDHDVTKDVLG